MDFKEVLAHLPLVFEGPFGGGSVESPIELSNALRRVLLGMLLGLIKRKQPDGVGVQRHECNDLCWAVIGKVPARDMGPRPPAGFGARLVFTWTVVADRSPGA